MKKFRFPLAPSAAIVAVVITLLLVYFFPSLFPNNPAAEHLQTMILDLGVVLATFAGIAAIMSLVASHYRKMRARRNPDRMSFFTLAGFVLTFVAGLVLYSVATLDSANPDYRAGVQIYENVVVSGIQVPVEASLMAVLAVTLCLACFRLFQRRQGLLPIAFIVSALAFLLYNSGIVTVVEGLISTDWMDWFAHVMHVLPIPGGRGILLGIALGSIMAGLRILFGTARPYNG